MLKKFVICLLAVVLLQGIIFTDTASAHRMYIVQQEPGQFFVFYDGREAATMAVVTLYDEDDNILLQESVNSEGIMKYNPRRVKAVKAVADDGMGHRATYNYEVGNVAEVPIMYKLGFGLALLVFVAAFFNYRNQQKNKSNV
ncbi:hypothetical protein BHF68_13710 [Desulfuribacillus alkaliarsenatis]|uniref:Uncharacterized protein n=2 Tax=Desulfuribacillus alkaliarsenatis TaxID=766136 RepID=A0A1E5G3Y7_9FIRM|nr:hypothetical protein BHF68_13710 [Desulfuribacillus alkaliarsenatis]